jgi:hypothetical protein
VVGFSKAASDTDEQIDRDPGALLNEVRTDDESSQACVGLEEEKARPGKELKATQQDTFVQSTGIAYCGIYVTD